MPDATLEATGALKFIHSAIYWVRLYVLFTLLGAGKIVVNKPEEVPTLMKLNTVIVAFCGVGG